MLYIARNFLLDEKLKFSSDNRQILLNMLLSCFRRSLRDARISSYKDIPSFEASDKKRSICEIVFCSLHAHAVYIEAKLYIPGEKRNISRREWSISHVILSSFYRRYIGDTIFADACHDKISEHTGFSFSMHWIFTRPNIFLQFHESVTNLVIFENDRI